MKKVLETNETSDDELEAEHQETIALIDHHRKTAPSRSGPSETVLSRKKKNSKESGVFRTSNQRGKNTHSKNTLISSGLKENVFF